MMMVGILMAATLLVDPNGGGNYTSVAAAARAAKAGDVVLVRPGVYRETVLVCADGEPERPIVFRSERRHGAVITGSEKWTRPWRPLAGEPGLLASEIDVSYFKDATHNPYLRWVSVNPYDKWLTARPYTNGNFTAETQLRKTLGQIFIDREELTEATSLAMLREGPDTWMVSPDGKEIWLHPAPGREPFAERKVEWSVRDRLFAADHRGRRHIVIDGFVFRHCANQGPFPQIGMVDTCSGEDWTIENNEIAFAKSIGLAIGGQSYRQCKDMPDVPAAEKGKRCGLRHLIRRNHVHDNGVSGIAGWNMRGCRIVNNLVERNHREVFGSPEISWSEMGGITLHCSDTLIAGNIVRDNDGFGIWLDTNYGGSRITGNLVLNNAMAGIFFESDFGCATADHNIVAHSRGTDKRFPGDGIYSHNGSCVTVAHNLLVANAGAGVRFRVVRRGDIRGVPPACATNRFFNNVFFDNSRGAIVYPSQPDVVAGTEMDGNIYLANDHETGDLPSTFCFDDKEDLTGWTGKLRGVSRGEWTKPFGWDAQSLCTDAGNGTANGTVDVPPGGRIQLDSYNLVLKANGSSRLDAFRAKAIAGLEDATDFRGRRYPPAGSAVKPGPFQDVPLASARISVNPYDRTTKERK